ncbi:MAG TPA: right-handed parallel beta-helix repeat-containing protein [Acetobacteraceae bacterium]|nr:right-handed parallel beta-helix repeat-containing protein [Acetobacteraceae bacterium]
MSETFSPIPNFSGVNAGQQFRQAVNEALGGSAPISPVIAGGSMTGGTISGANLSAAVAAAMLTDAAERTLAARATDAVNFADYQGADPTGAADMAALVDQALTDARAQKKALRFPAGTWGLASAATIQAGDVIVGDGPESVLQYIGPVGGNMGAGVPTVLSTAIASGAINPPASGAPLVISNIHVVGPWNGTNVTTELAGPMIRVQAIDSVLFDRVFVENATNVSISAAFCRRVRAANCKIRNGARDGIQCEGSAMVEIIGGEFDHIDDNYISAHSNTGQAWALVSGVNIIGTRASDVGGISCQGARRINILGNVIERPKQVGIEVAFVGLNLAEGESAALAVRIAGNVITDCINRQNIDGLDTECNYIAIGSVPAQAGAAAASPGVPGTNTTILPLIWQPDLAVALTNSLGQPVQTIDANGNIQRVTTAGTTGASLLAFNAAVGGTTADGTVTWTNAGSGIVAARVAAGRLWMADRAFVIGAHIVDANGNVQQCTVSGVSGAAIPAFAPAAGGTTADGTVTWTNAGANGQSVPVAPYASFNAMKTAPTDTATPLPPGWAIEVTHNLCMRTLDPTANLAYAASNAGGEAMFTRNGLLNPLLGSVELVSEAHGVHLFSFAAIPALLRHVRIAGNHLQGLANPIFLAPGVVVGGADIHDNRLIDFTTMGINCGQAGANHRIDIRDNEIDGDPFAQGRGTATGGAWQSGVLFPAAVFPNGCTGLTFRGNRLRNLAQVTDGAFAGDAVVSGNIVYCEPVSVGFNAGNLGVGTVPVAGVGFAHVIEGANPASAGFGVALNGPVLEAAAQPTSGIFVQGQIVWNAAAEASGGQAVLGWYRATTGAGNVTGTDWLPIVVGVAQVLALGSAGGAATVEAATAGDAVQVSGNGTGATELGTAGAAGSPVVFQNGQADGSFTIEAAGTSFNIPNFVSMVYFTASATIASFALTMPTVPPANGWRVRFSFNQAVTALAMNHGTGQSFDGTHASLTAHQMVEYAWDAANATWRMLQ